MKRSGTADLPLHYGHVPRWLYERMSELGFAITEAILVEYGKEEVLRRLSDSFWFQSFGAVLGMDWHSSGITTSVLGALKRSVNRCSRDLGIYICGGKGKFSRETPMELTRIAERTGLDGNDLIRSSKLSAKVDNTAVQDGFQLYSHNFILTDTGAWTVIQQGMRLYDKTARRYHWHSKYLQSFIEEPHTAVCGINQGEILNLTAKDAASAREGMLRLTVEQPVALIEAVQRLQMPFRHDIRSQDVNLKRLGTVLWLAHEQQPRDFEELLSLQGVGPRTIQSLALLSEIIHGSPTRFSDPARFSFAHGGKDGHPFPVPLKVYDESIATLKAAVGKAKIGAGEKSRAIQKLHEIAAGIENHFHSNNDLDGLIQKERDTSWKYNGKTVGGDARKPPPEPLQLQLF